MVPGGKNHKPKGSSFRKEEQELDPTKMERFLGLEIKDGKSRGRLFTIPEAALLFHP